MVELVPMERMLPMLLSGLPWFTQRLAAPVAAAAFQSAAMVAELLSPLHPPPVTAALGADANWIESMNSLMDDNRLLTLPSNERIRLLPHMKASVG
jgi:hypothetical protein